MQCQFWWLDFRFLGGDYTKHGRKNFRRDDFILVLQLWSPKPTSSKSQVQGWLGVCLCQPLWPFLCLRPQVAVAGPHMFFFQKKKNRATNQLLGEDNWILKWRDHLNSLIIAESDQFCRFMNFFRAPIFQATLLLRCNSFGRLSTALPNGWAGWMGELAAEKQSYSIKILKIEALQCLYSQMILL